MKYPIDAEEFIAAVSAEFGPDEFIEDLYRLCIPAVNAAYQDGIIGHPGYPKDFAKEIARLEEEFGEISAKVKYMLIILMDWTNAAYAHGQRDAKGNPA